MTVQVSYPGVYIDEFEPAAPIQGVSTSIAGFLGANGVGPPNEPTLITSWDAYQRLFTLPATPPEDDDYLWYAVRGYFANGGQKCFVTAVTNAGPDSFALLDERGAPQAKPTVIVTARRNGVLNPQINVIATAVTTVSAASLLALADSPLTATTVVDDRSIAVADAGRFLAGDSLEITGANNARKLATVAYTEPAKIFLTDRIGVIFNSANARVKLAPLTANAKTFRVTGPAGATGPASLVAGSIVTFAQAAGAGGQPPAPPDFSTVVTSVRPEQSTLAQASYRVTVRDGLNGFVLDSARPINITSSEFTLTVRQGTNQPPPYAALSMEPSHPRYFAKIINEDPAGLIRASLPEELNNAPLPQRRPITAAGGVPLAGGANHEAATVLADSNFFKRALARIAPIKDISIVAVPGLTAAAVQSEVLGHCTTLFDRFAIFDADRKADLTTIQAQAASLDEPSGFGALYFPWIEVASAKPGGARLAVPPSGHVAGIYARTDIKRGVHKAPAGNEAVINEALGVTSELSDIDQGVVNMKGVDVIRVFRRGGRPLVWGARTTSSNTNWQYVNIRRLFIFLEQSIQLGIRGAVFEPNNLALWQKLKRTITAFLTQQWRDGALFGAKAEDAFYVRIDEALNPDNERALGRLYIEIGVRPSYPAEFIIVRIGIWQGGGEVSEG